MIQLNINIYILFLYSFPFLFFLQDIKYSSLCYTVGPCPLPILCIIVCIFWSQTPNPTLPWPLLSRLSRAAVLLLLTIPPMGFPGGSEVKNLPANAGDWVGFLGWEDPLENKWQPTPVFLPGKSHEQRSLMGYSPWGHKRVSCNLATKQHFLPMVLTDTGQYGSHWLHVAIELLKCGHYD